MTSAGLRGVLPVDKPTGPTSHGVVAAARRALKERRIGHTGTLDPFASGLMLLCLGPATRLAEFLTGMDKRYVATARLGVTTDSGDLDGEVVATSQAWEGLTEDAVGEALSRFQGTIRQRPPALSAKKVDGVPAHRRVRRGEEVSLKEQEVTVYELSVLSWTAPDLRFEVRCSTGTYIRSLARDLGEALGVGAHLTGLRRTAVGPFTLEGALSLEALEDAQAVETALVSPLAAVGHMPRLDVSSPEVGDLGHGRAVAAPGLADGDPVVAAAEDRLVAVGAIRDGWFRPRKVFPVA